MHADLTCKATAFATRAEISLGLGSSGLIWGPTNDLDRLLQLFAIRPGIEAAFRQRLDQSYTAAIRIITQMRDAVEALAQTLPGRRRQNQAPLTNVIRIRFERKESASLLKKRSKKLPLIMSICPLAASASSK